MDGLNPRAPQRFVLQRKLGEGAYGTVYEVWDRERKAQLALKALHKGDADALYRFKKEFRQLADLSHPNLVALYELLNEDNRWYYTMELVPGVSLAEALKRDPEEDPAIWIARVRKVFASLGEGLVYLHEQGRLHGDLKPSNVLVLPSGQAKLLDFGLLRDLRKDSGGSGGEAAGTPAYMSPEQARGKAGTEESDWYSAGSMLYEVLTGRLPFQGDAMEVLVSKQWFDAPSVSDSFPDVPDDLDRLCRELLARDPKTRPRGRMILKKIKGEDDSTGVRRILPRPVRAGVFVGRDGPLAILASATEAARRGRTVTVFVEGRSGMGKSALVTKFLERLSSRDHDAIVLTGRCYQQESVPYKAVDSVLDSLCEWLLARKPEEVAPLLPRHTLALARLFPVLLQVPAVHEAARELLGMPEAQELRRRAFAALKELLFNLSRRGLVVLAIDDLQWGDVDSALLLGEILTPPAPPLLLVAAYRSEERESSPVLAALRTTLSSPGDIHRILLEELPLAEAEEMAESLALSRQRTVSREWLEAVAQESGGNPSFIEELVRHSRAGDVGSRGGLSLDTVIASRITRLPVDVRRFLETVAVAGQPIPIDVAKEAARLEADERKVVALLRSEHLVWSRTRRGREEIELYHSRIRDVLLARLPADQKQDLHWRLATALAAREDFDAETLAHHFEEAGDAMRAARYTEEAAERAAKALAFDRSVRLYRRALTLAGEGDPRRRALARRLGEALSNAGRGRDAAEAFRQAAEGAPEDVALELSRRAAEQLLRSGYVDEGLEGLSKVLKAVGMELAKSPGQALRSFLLTRARLKLRGLSWKERKASDLPARTLARIDTCWAVALGLSMVDTIRGADFQARHLLLALEAGEPYRVARALGLEVGYLATSGVSAHEEVTERLEAARRAAEISNEPHAKGFVMLIAGISAALEGRFDEATFLATEAEDILRTECSGVAWELFNAQYFSLLSLYYLGHFRSLSGRLPQLLKEAEERGDLFAVTSLTTRVAYLARLAFDDPVGAREDVARAMARWSTSGFHVQHVWRLFAEIEIDLYLGAAREATERIEKIWGDLERSLLLRIQLVRIGAVHRRARAALAAARTYPLRATDRSRKLALATSLAKKIELEKALWADPLAALLRAGIAETEGDHEAAKTHLSQAELGFGVSRMAAYATAARARRAALVGGDEGREIAEKAERWLTGEGIRRPGRFVAMLAPGFGD